jgi:HD-like signal output (HDOD) protein
MLKKLFGKKEEAPELKGPPLSPAIAHSIMNVVGANAIPAMPSAAQKTFELSTNPNAEMRDFIEVIEADEALSARILKIANSVYFDRGSSSQTIEESVHVIGINELKGLLNATTLTTLFPTRHIAREQIWANDIATALCSRSLASTYLSGKEDLAFLAGLMHDIGKLLLLQRAPSEYELILEKVKSKGITFCRAEEDRFPFDHTEAGLLVGQKWNFSPDLLEVIKNHHKPWSFFRGEDSVSLTLIVKCADTIAHSLGLGHQKGFEKFRMEYESQMEHVWRALKLPKPERQDFIDDLRRAFESEYDNFSEG